MIMRYNMGRCLVLVALSLLVVSRAAEAQPAGKVARIGYLSLQGEGPSPDTQAFQQGLRDLGYVDGTNLVTAFRFAVGQPERLPDLAAELVRLQVDVFVTYGRPATRAAAAASPTTPIVMLGIGDPVGAGLVASLARPGGNITGLSTLATDLSGKRLELLKEALPTLARVAVLWNAADPAMTRYYTQTQAAAQALGVALQPLGVRDAADIDGALAAMTQERPDALFMIADVLTTRHSRRIVDFATQRQLPTMFEGRGLVAAGGLMAYGPSYAEQHRRATYYVDRILKGTKPADLPVEQPMKLNLVLNRKTAQALGLTLSPTLLFQADEVLQ
jgi:putative ABC transport system substrate-binding protein